MALYEAADAERLERELLGARAGRRRGPLRALRRAAFLALCGLSGPGGAVRARTRADIAAFRRDPVLNLAAMPLCFIEPQEAIRVVAESVGREARRQLLGEVVRAWVDEIPEDELQVHYAKAVEELDDDDLSMLAAWHASLEVGQPIANKEFLLGAFAQLGRPSPRGAAHRRRLQGRGRLRGRRERGAGAHHRAALALPGAPDGARRRGGRALLLGPAGLGQLACSGVLRHVEAPDGVRIACEVSGAGPPLVLVHGAGSARWSFDLSGRTWSDRFTVIAIDRRGRGDSARRRRVLARARVRRRGRRGPRRGRRRAPVRPLLRRARGGRRRARLLDLPRLALYEPAMGGVLSTGETIERWERLIEDGDRDTVMREFLPRHRRLRRGRDRPARAHAAVGGAPADRPDGPARAAGRAGAPLRRLAPRRSSTCRSLLLVGSESPAWAVRSVEALRETRSRAAELRVLEGQGHGANMTAPELLAAELGRFLATGSDVSGEP